MRPSSYDIASIYSGIETRGITTDLQGWNSDAPIFRELIERVRPSTIVEVGSWKGASAVHMAKLTKELWLDTVIYAIDFWQDPLGQKGDSQIPTHWHYEITAYQLFLHNIRMSGCCDRVIPVRTFSPHGPGILKKWGVVADLIYIDAGHDFESCIGDIIGYWQILRPGGVMLGDDFPDVGVTRAVEQFCEGARLGYERRDHAHWFIQKPL